MDKLVEISAPGQLTVRNVPRKLLHIYSPSTHICTTCTHTHSHTHAHTHTRAHTHTHTHSTHTHQTYMHTHTHMPHHTRTHAHTHTHTQHTHHTHMPHHTRTHAHTIPSLVDEPNAAEQHVLWIIIIWHSMVKSPYSSCSARGVGTTASWWPRIVQRQDM